MSEPLELDDESTQTWLERMRSRREARKPAQREPWGFVALDDYLDGTIKHEPPSILHRNDDAALFYPRKRHLLVGDGETMKTWMVLMAGIEVMRENGIFLALDYENTPEETVARLLALGASKDMLRSNFRLITPDEPITEKESDALAQRIAAVKPAFASIDSVGAGMGMNALDPNDARDWFRFRAIVVQPVFDGTTGAVVAIDHRSKDKTQKTAIGSVMKRNSFDVEIVIEAVLPFGRGMTGLSQVYIGKDRAGHLRATSSGGRFFGTLKLTANKEGDEVTGAIEAPSTVDRASSEQFIETQEDAQVMKLFADGGSRMRGAVDKEMGWERTKSGMVLKRLVATGKLQQQGKSRNVTYFATAVSTARSQTVANGSKR